MIPLSKQVDIYEKYPIIILLFVLKQTVDSSENKSKRVLFYRKMIPFFTKDKNLKFSSFIIYSLLNSQKKGSFPLHFDTKVPMKAYYFPK